jgi:Flp pilus assembly protein TadG
MSQRVRRCHGDSGAALVEMAFVLVPLSLLLFGIIVYGYLMSFRQNMTTAAAEGARAGAVAPSSTGNSKAIAAARNATRSSLQTFGEDCDNGRTSCSFVVAACSNAPTNSCVTVTVTYDYAGHPLLPDIPLVSSVLPSTFTSSNTAQVNT